MGSTPRVRLSLWRGEQEEQEGQGELGEKQGGEGDRLQPLYTEEEVDSKQRAARTQNMLLELFRCLSVTPLAPPAPQVVG